MQPSFDHLNYPSTLYVDMVALRLEEADMIKYGIRDQRDESMIVDETDPALNNVFARILIKWPRTRIRRLQR